MNSPRMQAYTPTTSPSNNTSTTTGNNLTEANAQAAGRQHATSIPLLPVDPAVFRFGNRSVKHTPIQNPYAGILEVFTCPITQEVVKEPVVAVPKNNVEGTQIPAHIYEAESIHTWGTSYREQNPYRTDVLDPTTKAPLYSAVRVHGLKTVVQTCIRNHDAWELEQTQFYKDTQLPHSILENPKLVNNFISTAQEFESMGALDAARDQYLEAFKYTQHTEVLEQYLAFLKRNRSAADLQLILVQLIQCLKSREDAAYTRNYMDLVVQMQKMHTVQPTTELVKYYEAIYRTTYNRSVLKLLIHIYRYGPIELQSIAKQIELFHIDLGKNPNDLAAYGSYRRYLRAVDEHTVANALSVLHFEALKRKYPHSRFESNRGISVHFQYLNHAIQIQDIPAIKAVLANGINLNAEALFGKLFIKAIKTGNLESVQLLLDEGIDYALQNENWESFLNVAVGCRNLALLKLLIEYGTYADTPGLYINALYYSASKGYVDIIDLLIGAGADVNNLSMNAYTPLMIAANKGHIDSVKALVAAGADVHLKNINENTVLHAAATIDCIDIIDILIHAGADVNSTDKDGTTSLMIAALQRHIKSMEALIVAGADVNLKNKMGTSTLLIIAQYDYVNMIDTLILKGANVNSTDCRGSTALMIAANRGNISSIEALIYRGALKDAQNINGDTALHLSVYGSSIKVIQVLLQAGASVDIVNQLNRTPLMEAVETGNLEAVHLLIEGCASKDLQDKHGWTALNLAVAKNHIGIARVLIQSGADVNVPIHNLCTPLMVAIQDGNIWMVRLLLESGALKDVRNVNNQTALHMAIINGSIAVIKALIVSGAKTHILDRDVYGLLMSRVPEMNLNPVDIPSIEFDEVIDLGLGALFAEVEAAPVAIQAQQPIQPNQAAVTEFLDAAREGDHVTIQRFIEMGLPIDETDENGDSALHLAIRRGSLYIVHLLIHAEASLNVSNNAGHTPLRLALDRGNLELVSTIRAAGGRIRS